jgi:hypothetical protein
MLTRGDIVDVFLAYMRPAPSRGAPRRAASAARRRIFLTEYEVRKSLTPGAKDLTIPKDVIVSPLAQEWLALEGIRIVYK